MNGRKVSRKAQDIPYPEAAVVLLSTGNNDGQFRVGFPQFVKRSEGVWVDRVIRSEQSAVDVWERICYINKQGKTKKAGLPVMMSPMSAGEGVI